MKLKNIILLSIVSFSIAAFGEVLSPDAAYRRVFSETKRGLKGAVETPALQKVFYDEEGSPTLYLYPYSKEGGFMLVAADDAVCPLIGYSETNRFATESQSAEMEWWLGNYSTQIKIARERGGQRYMSTRAQNWAAVTPMLTTTWNQSAPYNDQCPIIGGARSVTGCVATAMAQVLNYWEYPSVGKGEITYRPTTLDYDLVMDLSATEFDWDNMLDSYTRGKYSTKEAKAVSTLMKACGYSVNMTYDSGSSGAYSRDIRYALQNNFGYDSGMTRKERSDYTNDEWNNLIYKDLVASGPIVYSGASASGAHCFVCDGYDGEGYFHINWGWGGLSDGYFLLNELTPSNIGIGGHYDGYNIRQEAVVGITPPVGRLTLVGDLTIENKAADSGNVKGWGYTYRLNDFSNIRLSLKARVSGGLVNSPLFVTIYDTDLSTLKNGDIVFEGTFDQPVHADQGVVECSTILTMKEYDPSKLYTLFVSYNLKGQKTPIGNLRFAASSGVEEVMAETEALEVVNEGNVLKVNREGLTEITLFDVQGREVRKGKAGSSEIDVAGLPSGVYFLHVLTREGENKNFKLLLK